jgi:lipopolysaccharide/colanic/teichoic acid biosynthesis glycosyltransferase
MGPIRTTPAPRSVASHVDTSVRTDVFDAPRGGPVLERILAGILLMVAAPLLLAVGLIVWIADGRPVFYRGSRLGRNRKKFTIYKFRTLRRGAQKVVGGRLVSDSDGLTIPFGRALRACRFDELPQLLNIVRGEMRFWGPRPERPEVYRAQCSQLEGYDHRFRVAPGLVGISQLFTPHQTPKRFRVKLDNRALETPPGVARQTRIITYTAFCALRTVSASSWMWLREDVVGGKLLRRHKGCRTMKRVRPRNATFRLDPTPGIGASSGLESVADIVDLNELYLRVRSVRNLSMASTCDVRLRVPIRRNGRVRHRSARCIVSLKDARLGPNSCDYVFRYEPRDSYSEYVVHQYFLGNSLATPARFVGSHVK